MREVLPIIVLMALVIGGVIAAIVIVTRHQRQVLEQVARHFRGRFEQAQWWQTPQIRLRFQGYPALLKYTQRGKRQHTHFQITFPDQRLRCELYPQDAFAAIRRLMGMEDIEIGSPQFDAAFFISGNSRPAVRELLSADVQAAVFRLAGHHRQNVHVEFAGGVMTVTRPMTLRTVEQLTEFIMLSSQLFLAALATRVDGITFVESAELPEPDQLESQCHICGEPLASDLVYCGSCRTPHHRECWEYFGSCATYACGHKQYVVKQRRRKRQGA